MAKKTRCFNAYDIDRIRGFLELATAGGSQRYRHLVGIRQDIDKATIVAPEAVPPDVITLNSRARIVDLATGQGTTITLVFPQDEDYERKRVSLLAPLGAALLGRHQGEEVAYEAPGGSTTVRIEEILYQPEAAGDYSA